MTQPVGESEIWRWNMSRIDAGRYSGLLRKSKCASQDPLRRSFSGPVPMLIYRYLEEPELCVRGRERNRPGTGGFDPKWCSISGAPNNFLYPLGALESVKVV